MKKPDHTSKPTLTEAEWELMHRLWEAHPCTAGAIQERLADSRGWAYSTVKTMLDRMVDKGILEVRKEGKQHLYSPAAAEEKTRLAELKGFLGRAFGGSLTPALQLLADDEDGLDEDDVKALKTLIRSMDHSATGQPKGQSPKTRKGSK